MDKIQLQKEFREFEDKLLDFKVYVASKKETDDGLMRFWNGYVVMNEKALLPVTIQHQVKEKLGTKRDGTEFTIRENSMNIQHEEIDENENKEYIPLGYASYMPGANSDKILVNNFSFNFFGDEVINIPMQGWVNAQEGVGPDALSCCLTYNDYSPFNDKDYDDPKKVKYNISKWAAKPQHNWEWAALEEMAEALEEAGNFTGFKTFISKYFPSSKINQPIIKSERVNAVLNGVKGKKAKAEISPEEIPF